MYPVKVSSPYLLPSLRISPVCVVGVIPFFTGLLFERSRELYQIFNPKDLSAAAMCAWSR